jgi:hypothetical protein
MSLFKVKAKVLLSSEEDMEQEEKYDFGNIAKSKEWVWRDISVPFEEIYKIISYSSTKSIIQMYDGEKMLVNESFDSLNEKWEKLREDYPDMSHAEWVEEYEEEEDS